MYRIARIGGDPEQTGLEVSEHGLLIAWPWLGVLGLLQMLGKWGDGGELR
jgi:hypothetical protein